MTAEAERIEELEGRVKSLEREREQLRAATAAAWARLITLVQAQSQQINKQNAILQSVVIKLNRAKIARPSVNPNDTGPLIKQQRARWLVRLRDLMCQYFSEGELENLCFDFGIDYEMINGGTKRQAVRKIITYFARRDTVELMVSRLQELRPSVLWPLTAVEVDLAQDVSSFFEVSAGGE